MLGGMSRNAFIKFSVRLSVLLRVKREGEVEGATGEVGGRIVASSRVFTDSFASVRAISDCLVPIRIIQKEFRGGKVLVLCGENKCILWVCVLMFFFYFDHNYREEFSTKKTY